MPEWMRDQLYGTYSNFLFLDLHLRDLQRRNHQLPLPGLQSDKSLRGSLWLL